MAVIDFFVDRVWAIAAFAFALGVLLDLILFNRKLRATILLPIAVGVMWLWGDSAQMVLKWKNEASQRQNAEQIQQKENIND
jgi:membrane protein implicated in regulation of membrane protease activity